MLARLLGANYARAAIVPVIAGLSVLGACTMPASIGSFGDVQSSAKSGQIQLIPLTAQTLPVAPPAKASFPADFIQAGEYDYGHLGPGDRVAIRIYESGTPSLFGPSGAADLGEVAIDDDGRLYVPYAGTVHAAGMTAAELRSEILRRLRTVVAKPQVDIRPVETRSRLVTVQGAAAKSGTYPIDRGRSQLGQLLAEVAPDQKEPDMLAVTVRRGTQSATVRLSDIYSNPALDIPLRPNDSVIITPVEETVTVLGATGQQGTIQIPKRDFTLLEALGSAKGLSGEAADPKAVFVVRAEGAPGAPALVYQVDMRRPESVALANRFVMRPDDAILVSNASFANARGLILALAQVVTAGRNAALVIP